MGGASASSPLWTSDEVIQATGGAATGARFDATGVTFDSREVEPGDLFVALQGERDGHDFVPMAFAKGAAAALVSRPVEGGPQVRVDDTLKGLEALGAFARDRAPQVRRGAVTGSVGKTSVTQAVAAGLKAAGRAHHSVKSFNNHIGVPLTLARMPRDAERAVFEIGMNAPGEIAPLSRMVQPHAALITTIGPVHIEAFADGEAGVAAEKAAIFEGLGPGGLAIINGDSRWLEPVKQAALRHRARVLTFGTGEAADARLLEFEPGETGARITARLYGHDHGFSLGQPGFHWGLNSLAVLLMLEALDVPLETGIGALSTFAPLAGRGQTRTVAISGGDFTLIDESYNANPLSMTAGFKSLGVRPALGRRIVVLTDMLELGDQSRALHEGLAEPIEAAGLDLVFTAGEQMRMLDAALPPGRRGAWAPSAAELAPLVIAEVRPGDVVMVKGSNGSRASLVAKALSTLNSDTPEEGA